jgi:hypothetical protein
MGLPLPVRTAPGQPLLASSSWWVVPACSRSAGVGCVVDAGDAALRVLAGWEAVVSGEFTVLAVEFLVDEVWRGRGLAAELVHLKAPTGSGGSTGREALWAALGLEPAFTGEAGENVQAVRTTVQVASGVWTATWERARREVTFVNEAGGITERRPVKAAGGQQSAGAFTLGLMGIPALATSQGEVTLECVRRLLCLPQEHAGAWAFPRGGDQRTTMEIVFGVLDEDTVRVKARHAAAEKAAKAARRAAEKERAKRQDRGLPVEHDFDVQEQRLREQVSRELAAAERLEGELDQRRAALAGHQTAASAAREHMATRTAAVEETSRAQHPLLERLGQARARLALGKRSGGDCPGCKQGVPARGKGQCWLCGQDDPRQDRLHRERETARAEIAELEATLEHARRGEREALARRVQAQNDWLAAVERVEDYRAKEIAPWETALAEVTTRVAVTRVQLEALDQRRGELAELAEREQALAAAEQEANDARRDWEAVKETAEERRDQVAKELSVVFADFLTAMDPEVRTAAIDPATLTPRVNERLPQNTAIHGGQITLTHIAYHLTLLAAAWRLPGCRLPAFQWLDSPLEALDRHRSDAARAILRASREAGPGGQVVLATAGDLPGSHPGMRTIALNSQDRFIPHLTSSSPPPR